MGCCSCHPLPLSPLKLLQDPRDDVSGEKLVADDMLQFLQEFFEGEQVVESFQLACCHKSVMPLPSAHYFLPEG